MNLHDLHQAKTKYTQGLKEILKERKPWYELRSIFNTDFNINTLNDLDIDDYVIGKGKTTTFCYRIEWQLDGLGSLNGATAFKFGIFYGKKIDNYRFESFWGNSKLTAYKNIILAIIELINAGKRNDIKAILDSRISPMLKGKILSIYYPDEFLNIFSEEHLNHFLKAFDLDITINIKADPIIKRQRLVDFKNSDPVMKKWTIDVFSHFLYTKYPKGPSDKKVKPVDLLEDYYDPQFSFKPKTPINIETDIKNGNIVFPLNQVPVEITGEITEIEKTETTTSKSNNKKTNYTKKSRENSIIGERGEEIVKRFEVNRLSKYFDKDKDKDWLEKNIIIVSKKDDTLGYDIKSFNNDKSVRYIEVKTTRNKETYTNFYISANEKRFAENEPNYYLYLVYEILSVNPKIWVVGNPFKPLNTKISIEPSAYKIKINTKWNTTTQMI